MVFFFVLMLAGSPARAGDAGGLKERFDAGLKAAWGNDPQAAWGQFHALWQEYQVRTAPLAYNLGVTALTRGKPSEAVYFLREAQRLSPDAELAEDVARALEQARGRLAARGERDVHLQQLVYGRVTGVLYGVLHAVPEAAWAWALVAALGLLAGLHWLTRGRGRWWSRALGGVLLALGLALGAAWATRVEQDRSLHLGVVTAEEASLREALDPASPVHPVPGGTEVLLLEDRGGEVLRVKLPTGRKGWIPRQAVGLLEAVHSSD
jgi:hypothetical protein